MRAYFAIGAAVAFLTLAGLALLQTARLDAQRAENAALRLAIDGCNARLSNIQRDKESDDAVDNIPDDGLRTVPDGWLLPPGSGGIY
jgi:Tfp pilus assembly protein PilN